MISINKITKIDYVYLKIYTFYCEKIMKVVILAAGRGSRMKEWTEDTTKAMLPLADTTLPLVNTSQEKLHKDVGAKPMLQITVERCIECGLKDFVFVVGYRKEDVIQHFGDGSQWGIHVQYVTQPNIKGGTADAVGCVESQFKDDGKFLLIYGDVVPSKSDIENILSNRPPPPQSNLQHVDDSVKYGVMAVRTVDDPERHGVVEIEGDKIIRIIEKSPNPPTNLINSGIYVLPYPEIFDEIRNTTLSIRGEYELTDSIQQIIDKGIIVRWQTVSNVQDIGTKSIYDSIRNQTNVFNNCFSVTNVTQ